jgi:hypothetical protein
MENFHAQKELIVEAATLDEEVTALIAQAVQHASLADIALQVGCGVAKVFRVRDGEQVVMAFVLRVDHLAKGSEGVIVAAGGACDGVDLTATMIPTIERMFVNCKSMRVHTARPGLVKLLVNRFGCQLSEMVLTKGL